MADARRVGEARQDFHVPFRPRRRSPPRPRLDGLDSRTRTTGTRRKRLMVPMHGQETSELSMNQPLPVNCPVEPEDRDRSPVAARGPRQQPGKITEALVLARPLRAGTACGPNPTKEFDGRSRRLRVTANEPDPKAILPEAPGVKKAISHDYRV